MTFAEQLTDAMKSLLSATYEAGKASGGGEDLWGELTEYGARTNYYYAFAGSLWTDEIFNKCPYTIRPLQASRMFQASSLTDISQANISFDRMTGGNDAVRLFESSAIRKIGTVDLSKSTKDTFNTLFANNDESKLETIELLVVSEGNKFGSNFFQNCTKLTNITISGTIGCSMNFQWCTSLSVESMKSIILALKDFDGNGGTVEGAWTQTITFPDECWTALEADGTFAPNGENWKSYVENRLAWNV